MRSALLDDEDLVGDVDPDPDLEAADEDGPPALRARDYETQIQRGHRQAGTTYKTRERRPETGTRSPWESLPRDGATAQQAQRFAAGEAVTSAKVRGVTRDYEGIR